MVQKVWTNSMGVFRYSFGKFNYFWPFCVGLAYMCGRNALKSHSGTKLGIVNKLELLIWCFTNIHSKPQPKMSKKYTILQLWPQKNIFPQRSTYTGRRRISKGIFWGINRRCSPLQQKVMAKKRRQNRFYSRIFMNIFFMTFFVSSIDLWGQNSNICTLKSSQNSRNSF